ncbi:MAG: UDP-N-acetylmuramoyl-L-alanyl-D-glutamate--2,6-diaminopimelate ligase [Chloroflexota bacterium]
MTQFDKKPQPIFDLLARWQTAVSGTNLTPPPTYSGLNHLLTNLVDHTADVVAGSCFVARVGTQSDGHRFISKAIAQGALLIVGQQPSEQLSATIPKNVSYLQVENSSETYAWLSSAWYDFPSYQMTVIGVTGTDGKTTTTNFLHQILQSAGIQTGLLSTLKAQIGEREEPLALHVTTPEAPVVQRYLRRMVNAGMTHCILETTSHALAQHRVTAVEYDIAIVTNITHEHLDYHGTHDAYVQAKKTLFEYVAHSNNIKPDNPISKAIIINQDDPISFKHLSPIHAPQQFRYAIDNQENCQITANDIQLNPWSTQFQLGLFDSKISITTKMFGLFNIYNMMAAAAAAKHLGVSEQEIQQGLNNLTQLYGRMQSIHKGQPFLTIVDFAHTPNGLEKSIDAAKRVLKEANKNGKIITVFGSAGLRDPEKRTLMAQISGREASLTILTAEDPRTEPLDKILDTMAKGVESVGGVENKTFWRISDRGQAIYAALQLANPEDLVLICGKGHEQSMCFGTIEYPWDDVEATKTALEAWLQNQKMPNLGLPTYEERMEIQ